jgi:hypothetical protein
VTTNIPVTALSFGLPGATPSVVIQAGSSFRASLRVTPSQPFPDPAIVITSTNSPVAVASLIHNFGVSVLARSPGNAVIRATYGAFTANINITVSPASVATPPVVVPATPIPATAIALTSSALTLTPRLQADLGAVIAPGNFNKGSMAWVSSDANKVAIANVSGVNLDTGIYRTGYVATLRGIATGTATITAIIGSVNASCVVTVI